MVRCRYHASHSARQQALLKITQHLQSPQLHSHLHQTPLLSPIQTWNCSTSSNFIAFSITWKSVWYLLQSYSSGNSLQTSMTIPLWCFTSKLHDIQKSDTTPYSHNTPMCLLPVCWNRLMRMSVPSVWRYANLHFPSSPPLVNVLTCRSGQHRRCYHVHMLFAINAWMDGMIKRERMRTQRQFLYRLCRKHKSDTCPMCRSILPTNNADDW